MMYLILVGDMLVMAFMIILVVYLYLRSDAPSLQDQAEIPLFDESRND